MLARSPGAAKIVLVESNWAGLDASAAAGASRCPLDRVLDGPELVIRGQAIKVTIEP
jgi:hypothetical protein